MKITSLEGFECGGADQRERRSDHVPACPSVTVNPLGSLSDRARNGHTAGPETNALDLFLIREFRLACTLSYLGSYLPRAVRRCPMVSVAVSGDRYSVGYSLAHGHVCDSRLRRRLVAFSAACADRGSRGLLLHVWSTGVPIGHDGLFVSQPSCTVSLKAQSGGLGFFPQAVMRSG
jgi:hypothetical protein